MLISFPSFVIDQWSGLNSYLCTHHPGAGLHVSTQANMAFLKNFLHAHFYLAIYKCSFTTVQKHSEPPRTPR